MSNTATADLAAWLTQIWDEEERHAHKDIHVVGQTGGDWTSRYGYNLPYSHLARDNEPFADVSSATHAGDAMLMARFKPSTVRKRAEVVLTRIAADRKILELHRGPHDCRVFKTGSHPAGWVSAGSPAGQWVYVSTERYDNEPCPTVRLLASAYADRPGFREEWR